MNAPDFACPEVAVFWRYISSSVERLVRVAGDIDVPGLHWRPPATDTNSIAVLVTHTMGNAEENILETLCGERVGRQREGEFVPQQITAAELADEWSALRPRLAHALAALPCNAMDRQVEHPRRGQISGREVLIVVARHAAEHLGQAELTRDLWLAEASR